MKQTIKIHIEYNYDEESTNLIKEMSEAERIKEIECLKKEIRNCFSEFPDECIKQLEVYIEED